MGSGRPDIGDGATSGKIFVGGLAQGTTLDTFVKYFGNYGEITDSVIMKDRHTGRLRGFGFITYADPSVVDTVIAETHIINGKQVEIKRTIPKVAAESKDFKTKRIFVGGIPTSMTDEDEFKNFFSKYGKVVEHKIIQDYMTKKSQGFGFIVFDNEQVVDNILVDGNMIDMLGTQVEIKKAEPKKPSNHTLAHAYCSDSRGRAFGDSFGGFGNSYSSFGSGSFDHPPFRSMGSSLGGGFGDYGGYGDTSEFGGPYGDFASSEYGYRGDDPLGYSGRFGSYGGGYDEGGLGAYGRGGGYGSCSGAGSGPGAGYGGGGLYGSRAGYSGGSRYHPYGRFLLVGAYKLNTDGRVKGGSASGGGIIRNHGGHCIRAFSAFYGDCKILEAELRAILDGILLARRLGITSIWIEADSSPAINSIIKMRGPLSIQEILKQIRDILHLNRGTIAHIYRENNRVADSLASVGWEQKVYREYGMKDLPDNIRALVHIDRLELPSFRDKV